MIEKVKSSDNVISKAYHDDNIERTENDKRRNDDAAHDWRVR